MQDNKLAEEEARRSVQHEAVKAEVETDVNSEIATRATAPPTQGEAARMNEFAGELRGKAINETIDTEREVERARGIARVSQMIDYVFYVIYGLLSIRLLLALMAARSNAGFVQLIRTLTDPLYAPFRGIVPSPTAQGGFTLALPIIIALVVYFLLHLAITGLLRMFAHRKTSV